MRQSVHVGDFVSIEAIDWNQCRGVICDVNPRKSMLTRPSVSNVSDVIVVLSFKEPTFDIDQGSRFLIAAEQTGLSVSLALNKSDLISSRKLEEQIHRFKSWGYKVFPLSVKSGEGIEVFKEYLKQKNIVVICGPSGVGKSSLINSCIPGISLRVGKLTKKIQRGRNTTRHVQLYRLGDNALIADTPGFNRPELNIEPIKLGFLFPEIREKLSKKNCRFRNCLHRNEPGCAIDKDWERYRVYTGLLEEMLKSSPQALVNPN